MDGRMGKRNWLGLESMYIKAKLSIFTGLFDGEELLRRVFIIFFTTHRFLEANRRPDSWLLYKDVRYGDSFHIKPHKCLVKLI
jgi:hypothetical protein